MRLACRHSSRNKSSLHLRTVPTPTHRCDIAAVLNRLRRRVRLRGKHHGRLHMGQASRLHCWLASRDNQRLGYRLSNHWHSCFSDNRLSNWLPDHCHCGRHHLRRLVWKHLLVQDRLRRVVRRLLVQGRARMINGFECAGLL